MIIIVSILIGVFLMNAIFFWLIFEERKSFICLMLVFLMSILLTYLIISDNKEESEEKLPTKEIEVCSIIPDHIRIKRRCGIPDSIEWSNSTRIKYGKQIEKVIKSWK